MNDLILTLNQFVSILSDYRLWFVVWLSFFISGRLMFGWLIQRLKLPVFSLTASLSLILFSLTAWQLAYLGLFPLTKINWLLAFWFGLSFLVYRLTGDRLSLVVFKRILIEFFVFSLFLTFWFWVRGFQPDTIGLEKYMDLGFINSIIKSEFLPAKDMWWAGGYINYYYFGHFLAGVLTLLTKIPTYFSYNLSLATVFAQIFLLSFGLVYNLLAMSFKKINKRQLVALSFLAAVFLNFASNWQTAYALIAISKNAYTSTFYWYPDATRFIDYRPESQDKTIHEFPAYSHVVADLHGHLSAVPLELVFLFLLLIYINLNKSKPGRLGQAVPFLAGLVIGAEFMTNSWDVIGFGLVWLITVTWFWLFSEPGVKDRYYQWIISGLVSLVAFLLAILPFKMHFTPFFLGIGPVHARSPLWMWLMLWGPFLIPMILFLVSKFGRATSLFNLKNHQFVFSLLIVSLYLLIFPEVLYFKDIYVSTHHRANTMFKLTYQAYIMMTMAVPYLIYKLKRTKPLLFVAILAFSLPLMYPFYSIPGYYGKLKPSNWHAGYGWRYLTDQNNGDYQLLNWWIKNVPGQPVIVEAVGDGYTQYARVSANTGAVAVLGWPVHEWLWRNQGYDPIGSRRQEAANFYQDVSDLAVKRRFLAKYKVKYVVIGWAEREAYPQMDAAKLIPLGKLVYTDPEHQTYVIEIKP